MRGWTTTLARLLFALPFAVIGLSHFLNARAMAAIVPIPGGVLWVYFAGAALVAGGIGIATKSVGEWAALGLALLVAVFVLTVHVPGLTDASTRTMAAIGLLKDLALCGGALTWAAIFAQERRARERQGTARPQGRLNADVAPTSR